MLFSILTKLTLPLLRVERDIYKSGKITASNFIPKLESVEGSFTAASIGSCSGNFSPSCSYSNGIFTYKNEKYADGIAADKDHNYRTSGYAYGFKVTCTVYLVY